MRRCAKWRGSANEERTGFALAHGVNLACEPILRKGLKRRNLPFGCFPKLRGLLLVDRPRPHAVIIGTVGGDRFGNIAIFAINPTQPVQLG